MVVVKQDRVELSSLFAMAKARSRQRVLSYFGCAWWIGPRVAARSVGIRGSPSRAPAMIHADVRVGCAPCKAALSSGCKPHPATVPAGSNRSSHGGKEVAEAFD